MKTLTNRFVSGLGLAAVILACSGSRAQAQAFGFTYVNPRVGVSVGAPGPIYPGYYGPYGYPPAVVAPPIVVARPPLILPPPVVVGRPYFYGGYAYPRYYRR